MIQEKEWINVNHKKTVISCVLAALSGLCFVSGVSLLVYEGSAEEDGTYKETVIND